MEEHLDRLMTGDVRDNEIINPNALMHRFYGAVDIDGKIYSVRTLVKEQKGSQIAKAQVYSLEEIEISDGHNRVVESEHLRKSETSIPLAKLLKDVENPTILAKKVWKKVKKFQE